MPLYILRQCKYFGYLNLNQWDIKIKLILIFET